VINVAAPAPVRQRELAAALGRAVRRPALVPAPTFALKLVLGGFESELLTSRRAVPVRLLESMNTFRFPELDEALRELVA
jgi:NAD dependent epimerase/dehydratase family enzyme